MGDQLRSAGLAGLLGGALWALWPLGTEVFFSTTAQASAAQEMAALFYALLLLVPAALIAFGLVSLQRFHADTYGRLGGLGTAVSVGALALMGGGVAIEGIDIAFLGQTALSDVAHGGFLVGFLALALGSIVLGIAIRRANRLAGARWMGPLLAVAIPAGIVAVIVKETIAPTPIDSDLWFWIAIVSAYGLAWIVLGRRIRLTERSLDTIGSSPSE
jgi:hypothetical protein